MLGISETGINDFHYTSMVCQQIRVSSCLSLGTNNICSIYKKLYEISLSIFKPRSRSSTPCSNYTLDASPIFIACLVYYYP
jgi:hypothetical protein